MEQLLYILVDGIVSFTGNTTFIGNGPSMYILYFYNCSAAIEGTLHFEYNQGGFTATETSNIIIIGMINFINNYVTFNQQCFDCTQR